MTPYAYKDMVIAYDSRVTRGSYIEDDDCQKCITIKGIKFFCTGTEKSQNAIIDYWFKGKADADDVDGNAFVWDGKNLYDISVDKEEGKIHKDIVDLSKYYAIGSGTDHAITAMDLGMSAYQAVRMAAKRDTHTGGKIRKVKLK